MNPNDNGKKKKTVCFSSSLRGWIKFISSSSRTSTMKTGIIRGGAASYFSDDFFTKNLNFEFFGRYYIVFLRDMYFGSFWSILYCLFEVLFDFSVDNSHIVLQCFREYHSVFLMIVLSNIWKYAPPPFPVNMPPPIPIHFLFSNCAYEIEHFFEIFDR